MWVTLSKLNCKKNENPEYQWGGGGGGRLTIMELLRALGGEGKAFCNLFMQGRCLCNACYAWFQFFLRQGKNNYYSDDSRSAPSIFKTTPVEYAVECLCVIWNQCHTQCTSKILFTTLRKLLIVTTVKPVLRNILQVCKL